MTAAVQHDRRPGDRYQDINEGKVDFGELYERPVPRAYFRELCGLGYRIPENARLFFTRLIDHLGQGGRPVTVLDLGCSYGVNALLLKYPGLSLERLQAHYTAPEARRLSAEEMVGRDRAWLAGQQRRAGLRVIGLDVAAPAIAYAHHNGVLDDGFAENLEEDEPSPRLREALAEVDLVVTTGCVGYVTERTFERLLAPRTGGSPPWIASTVLRMFPYDRIAASLEAFGLVTERLMGRTLIQRRFGDAEEQAHALATLARLGVDAAGKEADGHFHAELFVSRPAGGPRLGTLLAN
jgi:SAM-dependent methyltransferase